MRTLNEINADKADARSRREKIEGDLWELRNAHPDASTMDSGKRQRSERLIAGLSAVDGELESLTDEWQEAIQEGLRDGTLSTQSAENTDRWDSRTDTGGDPQTRRVKDQALRSNERASFLPDESKAHMERQLRADDDPEQRLARAVEALADRAYFRAFSSWLRNPVSGGHSWTQAERNAVQKVRHLERALGLGSQGGAFLVPYELDPAIVIANAGAVSPLRRIFRVETTALNTKKFVTSVSVTSTWFTEASQATDDSPTLLQPSIDAKKGLTWVPVSYELYEDSDIAAQIGAVFADARAVNEALSFTISQSNGPVGIVTALVAAGGSTVIATGTNALSTADLYANQAALPAALASERELDDEPEHPERFQAVAAGDGIELLGS